MKNEVEQLNGRIYDMSVEIITLNDASTRKQADLKRYDLLSFLGLVESLIITWLCQSVRLSVCLSDSLSASMSV